MYEVYLADELKPEESDRMVRLKRDAYDDFPKTSIGVFGITGLEKGDIGATISEFMSHCKVKRETRDGRTGKYHLKVVLGEGTSPGEVVQLLTFLAGKYRIHKLAVHKRSLLFMSFVIFLTPVTLRHPARFLLKILSCICGDEIRNCFDN